MFRVKDGSNPPLRSGQPDSFMIKGHITTKRISPLIRMVARPDNYFNKFLEITNF